MLRLRPNLNCILWIEYCDGILAMNRVALSAVSMSELVFAYCT